MRSECIAAIATVLLAAAAPVVLAQPARFPSKPVRLIVPFPAGGPVDATARTIGPRLSELLGQTIVIDNRAGANTIIGTEMTVKSPPDGHTMLLVTSAIASNPHAYRKLPYDALKDLAPVTFVMNTPFILIVHPALPARTAGDLVKLAKARPGELLYASSGIGGANHLAAAQFSLTAGIQTTHVPYKGTAPLLTDLIAGHVHFNFSNPLGSLGLVKAGKLKVLGVAAARRLEIMPELPTVSESGVKGYESGVWFGAFVAAGTPRDIVGRLNADLARTLAHPDVKQKLTEGGAILGGGSSEELAAFLAAETARMGKVVRAAGVQPE